MPGIEDEDDDDDVEGLAGKLYRKSVIVKLNEILINQRFLKSDKILVNQKLDKLDKFSINQKLVKFWWKLFLGQWKDKRTKAQNKVFFAKSITKIQKQNITKKW